MRIERTRYVGDLFCEDYNTPLFYIIFICVIVIRSLVS